jgi:hypothetical protein
VGAAFKKLVKISQSHLSVVVLGTTIGRLCGPLEVRENSPSSKNARSKQLPSLESARSSVEGACLGLESIVTVLLTEPTDTSVCWLSARSVGLGHVR